ncbi:MAG: hypothetical protein MJA84_11945, partial [Firmicutes bacterium]|nr:hypothetical protein [Bacillota bacterium]
MAEAEQQVYVVLDNEQTRSSAIEILASAGRTAQSFETLESFLAALLPSWLGCVICTPDSQRDDGFLLLHELAARNSML